MRFSTLVSASLLVGFAAALPAPNKNQDMTDSAMMDSASSTSSAQYSQYTQASSSSSYSSSSSSSDSGCMGDSCNSSKDSSSSKDNSSNDCKSGDCSKSSNSSMSEQSSSSAMQDSTTMMSETQSSQATSTVQYTSTSTSSADMSQNTYGSGSSNWGGSGYNDCVQQCVASYGAPPATWTPSSTQGSNDGSYQGSTGTGTTHTVIVAPTQGVLRYVPFAVNASVGDTVKFVWGAKNHTVTKSSALELCNKTTDALFTSGSQNAPFTFTQVVNDTNPTFFFCNTPGHCQKGMFGMINPPSAFMTSESVAQMMPAAVSNSSDMAAMMAYTNSLTTGNDKASSWGSNIDLAQLPEWAHASALENVMYTRAFLGANPETLQDNGFIDMGGDAPKVIPNDMVPVNNAVDSTTAAASSQSTASAASSASAAPTGAAANTNGAASTAASTALLGVAAFAAAVLAF